jgi:uncharacterized protein
LLERLAGGPPLETHISAVYLGTDTVWKLRKAMRLEFLDFSTLEARHHAACRELELNRPHAPGLYRDVVPVTRQADGTVTLGGDGRVLDWVVRMARVPQEDFLEEVNRRGGLTGALLDGLGDAVAATHAKLVPVARDQDAAMAAVIAGNVAAATQAGLDAREIEAWRDAADATRAALSPWLKARGQAGFVRRAHGDLHMGNICLWRGGPVPFDALEFDEDLATVDLGYDLAFLLMDLDVRASRPAANRVLNRYVARTGDWALTAGLKLFLSLRAMVRAHVEAARGHAAESRRYLDYAKACLKPAREVVVAVGGLPGTGKSTLARALAPELGAAPGALVLRSDEIRKRRHGVAPETRLPQSAYSDAESRAVIAELARAVREVAANGHAVIADATFMEPDQRRAIEQAARGHPFAGLWLQAPLAVLEARVAARTGDASDADLAVLRRIAPRDPGAGDWAALDARDGEAAKAAAQAAVADAVRAWSC